MVRVSAEYDKYLDEHIGAVRRAAEWLLGYLRISRELTDGERNKLLFHVKVHDASKYGSGEYEPYDDYFYGDADEESFSRAWLHHIHRNPHHWQHWLLVNGYGKFGDPGVVTALEMPKEYVYEMIADWWSFSWRNGNLNEIFGWYDDHRDKMILHPNTRELVERILDEIHAWLHDGKTKYGH